ncbi:MAG: methyltransferase domain-containing protein, partial [Bacteroidia bacterium]
MTIIRCFFLTFVKNYRNSYIVHTCPVCHSQRSKFVFKAQDYTVSQQLFEIWHCEDCQHRFTPDAPPQSEIGKYYQSENYVSHSDTKKGIINQLYHLVRKFSLQSKRKLMLKYTKLPQGAILDIGCGTGAFLNVMQQANWQIKGLEPDEGARKQAQNLYQLQPDEPQQLFSLA